MEQKINVTLERKDYVSLFVLLMNKKLILLSSAPLLLAIPLGGILLGYFSHKAGIPAATVMLPFGALVAVLALIFLRALVSPALRQFKAAQKEFGNTFTFMLNSDGFICHGGAQSAQYAYARLDRALETKGYYFFFVSGGQACIFPKRLLSAQEADFLQGILPLCATIPPGEFADALNPPA